ncbi:MAG: peptidoglycan editing factor PgeF [Thermoanaerobaculia bacterium]
MSGAAWNESSRADGWIFRPRRVPPDTLAAFSGRGVAPPGLTSPTEILARRLAEAVGAGSLPIVRATQVHGRRATIVDRAPPAGQTRDAGECDALATTLPNLALVVQTADCVPILLRTEGAIAAAHAGWRGSAIGVAGAALDALRDLGARAEDVEAWIGPSIGACCYEVGGEVARHFAGDFARRDCGGHFRLDLKAVNSSQLESGGVRPEAISIHPSCTKCGGDRYASYRRDGSAAGRMIGLIARVRHRETGSGRRETGLDQA